MCFAKTKGILAMAADAALRALLLEPARRCSEQFSPEPNQSFPFFTPSWTGFLFVTFWPGLPMLNHDPPVFFVARAPLFLLSAIANHDPDGCAVPSGLNFCARRTIGISA